MVRHVDYTLTRGLPWERLLVVKDRWTHRLLYPSDARAYIKTGDLTVAEITCTITTQNGIKLSLEAEETQDLPLGELHYDVMATVGGYQQPIAKGTIDVSALDTITPLEDALAMEIRYKQYTDYRRDFTWKDDNGTLIAVQSAFMQAKNSSGTTVIDLRWYATAPNEGTITGLPANRRGYLAPATGATLEMHLSNTLVVAPGAYSYDLFVQDTAGDWDCLVSGNLIVEAAVSAPPA